MLGIDIVPRSEIRRLHNNMRYMFEHEVLTSMGELKFLQFTIIPDRNFLSIQRVLGYDGMIRKVKCLDTCDSAWETLNA